MIYNLSEALRDLLPVNKEPTLTEQFKAAFNLEPSSLAKAFSKAFIYSFWDVVVAWRNEIYKSNFTRITKYNYLTGMLKLIEEGIINPFLPLAELTPDWYNNARKKIDSLQKWASATKQSRKTCLKSFYDFALNYIPYGEPQKKPKEIEILHMLSSIAERALTKDLDPSILLNTLADINERDTIIVAVMLFSGQTLEDVLDLKKSSIEKGSITFENKKVTVPVPLTNLIFEKFIKQNENTYVFVTDNEKRIHRTQVIRNLKLASKLMGLDFALTPKVLQGYAIAYFQQAKNTPI